MKRFPLKAIKVLAIALFASSTAFSSAFARTCYVDLVDAWSNYPYDTFAENSYDNTCRIAQRDCMRAKRHRNLDSAVCVKRGTRGPRFPQPAPPRTRPTNPRGPRVPAPAPAPRYSYDHLLGLSDMALAHEAQMGRVGSCRVREGALFTVCDYYVSVNGRGYPQGNGCADRDYTNRYGCKSYSDKVNAGCLIRKAIQQNSCR